MSACTRCASALEHGDLRCAICALPVPFEEASLTRITVASGLAAGQRRTSTSPPTANSPASAMMRPERRWLTEVEAKRTR